MEIKEVIKNFNKQFEYEPIIENAAQLKKYHNFIVIGMGGSHLAADLILAWDPRRHILIWSNYSLPDLAEDELKNNLVIASSYSGNTEEVIDGLNEAIKKRLAIAVIAIGGKVIEIAKENGLAYIKMPSVGIQPRLALGYSIRAILKAMGMERGLEETAKLSQTLKPEEFEKEGESLADELKGCVPIIYASDRNRSIAYNWKIAFNETDKIPAFYNVFPELNHNEMTGFNLVKKRFASNGASALKEREKLNEPFHFIFLKDLEDHPRILKRMMMTKKFYEDRGLPVKTIELKGGDVFYKIFSSLILADWTAYYIAKNYGLESEQIPAVEEFKKMLAKNKLSDIM